MEATHHRGRDMCLLMAVMCASVVLTFSWLTGGETMGVTVTRTLISQISTDMDVLCDAAWASNGTAICVVDGQSGAVGILSNNTFRADALAPEQDGTRRYGGAIAVATGQDNKVLGAIVEDMTSPPLILSIAQGLGPAAPAPSSCLLAWTLADAKRRIVTLHINRNPTHNGLLLDDRPISEFATDWVLSLPGEEVPVVFLLYFRRFTFPSQRANALIVYSDGRLSCGPLFTESETAFTPWQSKEKGLISDSQIGIALAARSIVYVDHRRSRVVQRDLSNGRSLQTLALPAGMEGRQVELIRTVEFGQFVYLMERKNDNAVLWAYDSLVNRMFSLGSVDLVAGGNVFHDVSTEQIIYLNSRGYLCVEHLTPTNAPS